MAGKDFERGVLEHLKNASTAPRYMGRKRPGESECFSPSTKSALRASPDAAAFDVRTSHWSVRCASRVAATARCCGAGDRRVRRRARRPIASSNSKADTIASVRLRPAATGSMVEDHFAGLWLRGQGLRKGVEITRFCAAPGLGADDRLTAVSELLLGLCRHCQRTGIDSIFGVVFPASGAGDPARPAGPAAVLGRDARRPRAGHLLLVQWIAERDGRLGASRSGGSCARRFGRGGGKRRELWAWRHEPM